MVATNNISELPRTLVDAENHGKGLKKSLILNIIRGKGVFGRFNAQNKDRLAGFLPSESYKAEENLISVFP